MNAAALARKRKEAHPEDYCPKCLWRVRTRDGIKPCPRHSTREERLAAAPHDPETCEHPTCKLAF